MTKQSNAQKHCWLHSFEQTDSEQLTLQQLAQGQQLLQLFQAALPYLGKKHRERAPAPSLHALIFGLEHGLSLKPDRDSTEIQDQCLWFSYNSMCACCTL